MISHALTIIVNELKKHFDDVYGVNAQGNNVGLRNIAMEFQSGTGVNSSSIDAINFTIVNLKEEKTLKNISNVTRNDISLTANYQNPPVFLNLHILVTATHGAYSDGLLMLSRAIRFFQHRHVFTQDDVAPVSLLSNAPSNVLDQLEVFKIIFDLYSPTMEESNHMWGTLGGKQYPFVMYHMRMLDLQFKAAPREGVLITEVVNQVMHKPAVGV